MFKSSDILLHRSSKPRGHILKDATLTYTSGRGGVRTLRRSGVGFSDASRSSAPRAGHLNATEPTKHAFPLLTHTDFGYHDHAANTKWIELANYMPKRNKGTPPWWRGADTYSPLYSEQGRYEYQRYLMISRFPSHYKRHFQLFLGAIRSTATHPAQAGSSGSSSDNHILPQEALHWILRMIVDNFNPQHVHYLAAMRALMSAREYDMARDVWRIMERQQTWPDDKLIACYLELCSLAGEKTWAIECWNRYCNEKRFLDDPDEADPKPVSRVPFTLNRDELLYLPKWKKHFDHDPNLDVADLNRFNTTRDIYRWMAIAMLTAGETQLFETLLSTLEQKLRTTRTPVPEPPNPQLMRQSPLWGSDPNRDMRRMKQWMPEGVDSTKEYCVITEMHSRFLSNDQFLVRTITDCIASVCLPACSTTKQCSSNNNSNKKGLLLDPEAAIAFCDKIVNRLTSSLGDERYAAVNKHSLFATVLAVHRTAASRDGSAGHHHSSDTSSSATLLGDRLLEKVQQLTNNAAGSASVAASADISSTTTIHAASYLEVLRGYADECDTTTAAAKISTGTARKIVARVAELAGNLSQSPQFEWTAEHHYEVMRVLVHCGTNTANKYFVSNVLRKFKWNSDFCELLYTEYRRRRMVRAGGGGGGGQPSDDDQHHESVDQWAELTKRMLVWTERYGVRLSERCKRLIEKDYDVIKVQVRSFREVAVFSFRDASEKKEAQDPASQLSNPVMDYVSHGLPFPDRDTGYPNEYGDIGQWRDPASGVKGPTNYAPPMHSEAQRGYTAEWRENTAVTNAVKMPAPWDKKYVEYNRGRHPSYDQIYAGPYPEIAPAKYDFRRPTRWDFASIEKQSKYKWSGPY